MYPESSGKCFFIILTNAGQHDVVFFLPDSYASIHSSASLAAVKSPPRPTSIISENPSFLHAVLILDIDISAPNCPSTAGANMAITFLPSRMSLITETISDLEPIAPNGHLWMHLPQRIHFSSSITHIPFSSISIAPTGHASLHGLIRSAMAL